MSNHIVAQIHALLMFEMTTDKYSSKNDFEDKENIFSMLGQTLSITQEVLNYKNNSLRAYLKTKRLPNIQK